MSPSRACTMFAEGESEIAVFKRRWIEHLSAMADAPAPTIEQQRAAFDTEHASIPPVPGCSIIPIESGTVRGERIVPEGADHCKALIYHHGGGHSFGSALSHRHLVSRLASAAKIVAYNMDYSLAPECPFPHGLNDAVENWDFVASEGFSADRIVIGGESAGGNLTLALALKLKQLGRELPCAVYLLSPWLDLTHSSEAYHVRGAYDPMVSREILQGLADAYMGNHSPRDPLVSPLYGDLTALPPLLVQAGTDEVLLGDSTQLAHRVAMSGGDVTLRVWPGMVHAWPLFHHEIAAAGNAAIVEAADWMSRRLS